MKHILFIVFIAFLNPAFSQTKDFSLFLSAGRASDNDAWGNYAGGGVGLQVWAAGPIFKFGAEYKINNNFSAQSFIAYSFYKYDENLNFGLKSDGGYNNIFDALGRIKWNLGIFYLSLGLGFSHQWNDEVRYLENTSFEIIKTKNETVLAGVLGLGFDINIYDRYSLLIEGDSFFREYYGSAWLIGVKYSLDSM